MIKLNCVHLDMLMDDFSLLEQKIAEVNGKNNIFEIMLEDASRHMKFYQTKEKSLIEERDSLLVTVNRLQQTLQEQCNLRVENERLKSEMASLKQHNESAAEDGKAELQRLIGEMRAEGERHQRELETVRQQSRREVEDASREGLHQLDAKDAEVKTLLEKRDLDLGELKKRLKDQERERQSELLKLQMEFGAKLARVQSTAQWSQQQQQQQQQHGSNLLPQSVFKRKLQFFQEEKNKEIAVLRQRIKELEENQRVSVFSDSRLKKRKI
ncbi:coiled-coil domain-containing protein 152 [Pseudochaenichthys georgianus]|uniref:coiled-coil domain-containing protein 152 n=1 Tax=Pseudochaenichthys georgianus TaxID=52239 RepID=UPI00146F11FA|nr:coiled-coil domain-containing protein 152-like isoform X1 [Pseudochaenichthys georgianus]